MDKVIESLTDRQLNSLINNYDYVKLLAIAELRKRNSKTLPIPKVGDCIEVKLKPVTWFIKITVVESSHNIRGDEISFNDSTGEVDVCENIGYSADDIVGFEVISSEFYDDLLEACNNFDEDCEALNAKFVSNFRKLVNEN